MRKTVAIVVLVLFACRPAFNIGYMLYFELNIDYIIETYCVNKDAPELQCNGQCHLTKTLGVANQQSSANDYTSSKVLDAFFPLYFTALSMGEIACTYYQKTVLVFYNADAYTPINKLVTTPPPQVFA